MKRNWTTYILWAVYIGLLLVLLPHTAWLFLRFEPVEGGLLSEVVAWSGAFAFEAAIAILTHKLAKHWEAAPKRFPAGPKWFTGWPKLKYKYFNAFVVGLTLAIAVSALANLAHSVEYGQELKIFAEWGIRPGIYQVVFGGILPLVSLLFARVLSNISESEDTDTEKEEMRNIINDLRKDIREQAKRADMELEGVRFQLAATEDRARTAETRFAAAGEMFVKLFGEEKRQRILAARNQWPQLSLSAIAIIAASSVSYVSEVLKED